VGGGSQGFKTMYNQNSGYGASLLNRLDCVAASVCPTFGRILVVMSPDDSADPNFQILQEVCKTDPDGKVRFFTTLKEAYDAATTNNNDVILMDAHSAHVIASQIAWSKSRIHVVGMEGSGRYTEQGTRITGTVGAATASLIKVTGTRNTFRNIKFIQNDTNAAAINVVISAGSSTLWQDCSFIFEVTDNLDLTTACEVLIAEAGGTFKRCVFGNDAILSTAARYVTELNAVTGAAGGTYGAKHCTFIDCMWVIMSSEANAIFFKTTKAQFRNTLINPVFHAVVNATNSAVTLTKAIASIATLGDGCIFVVNPAANTTDLCTTSTNLTVVGLSMNGGADTAYVGVAITPA
jgi:hypothetical protein